MILAQILQTRTAPTLLIAQAAAGLGLKMTQHNGILTMPNADAKVPQLPKSHMIGVILVQTLQTRTVPWNLDAQAATGRGLQATRLNGAQPTPNADARVPLMGLVR